MAARKKTIEQLQSATGIGSALAEKIWKKFGSLSIIELTSRPDKVAEAVSGLSPCVAVAAQESLISLIGLTNDEARKELGQRWEELFEERLLAYEVFHRHHDYLLNLPNVTGIHVGLKRKQGKIVTPLHFCIRIHVREKLKSGDPKLLIELPKSFDGIPVDVLERSYQSLNTVKAAASQFVNSIMGGAPIAREGEFKAKGLGTLGGVLFAGSKPIYITNQHVAGPEGTVIIQPPDGKVSAGQKEAIGKVIHCEREGSIDCAIIKPKGRKRRSQMLMLSDTARYGSGKLLRTDIHQTVAIKVGAISGKTSGVVKSVDTTVTVDGIKMPGQIVVETEDRSRIIEKGDSGSLLLVKAMGDDESDAGYFVVGLIHAATDDFTALVATHFDVIADRFGVSPSIVSRKLK